MLATWQVWKPPCNIRALFRVGIFFIFLYYIFRNINKINNTFYYVYTSGQTGTIALSIIVYYGNDVYCVILIGYCICKTKVIINSYAL